MCSADHAGLAARCVFVVAVWHSRARMRSRPKAVREIWSGRTWAVRVMMCPCLTVLPGWYTLRVPRRLLCPTFALQAAQAGTHSACPDVCFAVLPVLAGMHADSAAVPFSRRRAPSSSADAASVSLSDLSTPFNSNIYNTESQRAQRSGWWVRRAPRLLRGLP